MPPYTVERNEEYSTGWVGACASCLSTQQAERWLQEGHELSSLIEKYMYAGVRGEQPHAQRPFSNSILQHTLMIMGSIAHEAPETLLSVAARITEYAQQLTKELEAGNVPPVTLEADSPIKYEALPGNAFFVRQQLEDALKDMYILSQGPSESTFNYCHTVSC